MSTASLLSTVEPDDAENPTSRFSLADGIALVAILLVALFLRVRHLDDLPSGDELWHLALTTGRGSPVWAGGNDVILRDAPFLTSLDFAEPFWQIWTRMDGVLHPPLYVITLRLWRDVVGESFRAAQAYSIAWSLVAVTFSYLAARLAMNRSAAVLVALVLAVAPTQIYFAQEVRSYSMLIALAAIAAWMAARIERVGATPARAAALAAMALPMLLTHYFAIGAVVGIGLWGVVRFSSRDRRWFLGTSVIVALIYAAIWLPFALRQRAFLFTGDAFTHVDRIELASEAKWTLATPVRLLAEGPWLRPLATAWPAILIGAAILLLPLRTVWRSPRSAISAGWAMLAGSLAAIVLLDAARSTTLIDLIRYESVASPAAALLLVGAGWHVRRVVGYAVGGLAIVILALLPARATTLLTDSQDFTGLAAWAQDHLPPDAAILLETRPDGSADILMLTLACETTLLPRPIVKLTHPLDARTRAALPRQAWALLPGDDAAVPALFNNLGPPTIVRVPGVGVVAEYDLSASR